MNGVLTSNCAGAGRESLTTRITAPLEKGSFQKIRLRMSKDNDPPLCPYCFELSELIDSKIVYGKSYGMMYRCEPCEAHVGCHQGTTKALGRLANGELRRLKSRAHDSFDPIWRKSSMTRRSAYHWLADELGITLEECHIGMFDLDTCKKVIEICSRIS